MTDPSAGQAAPSPAWWPRASRRFWVSHLKPSLMGIDVFVASIWSLIFGGIPYWSISCRIGVAMGTKGSWAEHWTWPAPWRAHCLNAVFVVQFAADQPRAVGAAVPDHLI